MDALAALAVVASEVVTAEPESMGPAVPDPESDPMHAWEAGKRAEPLEVAQRKVAKCQASLDGAESMINSVDGKGALATQSEKKRAATARARNSTGTAASSWRRKRSSLRGSGEPLRRQRRVLPGRLRGTRRRRACRAITDAGICSFRRRSASATSLASTTPRTTPTTFGHRILHDFNQKGRQQDLPESDYKRGIPALKTLWQKFYGESKLWAAKAQRAVSFSGVHADEVEEKVKEHYNVTTSQFADVVVLFAAC